MTRFNEQQPPPESTPVHQTGAARGNDISGRCVDKESGEEQKGDGGGGTWKRAFVWGMKD